MTFREKLEKEYPDMNIGVIIANNCPCDYAYERETPCCPIDIGQDCSDCWNREIPEVNGAACTSSDMDPWNPSDPSKSVTSDHTMLGTENMRIHTETVPASQIIGHSDCPHILDSGNRRQFESGAVRDIQEGKGRCDLMALDVVCQYYYDIGLDIAFSIFELFEHFKTSGNPVHLLEILKYFCEDRWNKDCNTMFLEVSKHFEEGAKKYGENNWQKGIPVHCYIDSAVRHYLKFLRGDQDEPHDRAFAWNIMCAIWTCEHKPELNEYARTPDPKADIPKRDYDPVSRAYDIAKKVYCDGNQSNVAYALEEIVGYLGEALDG